MTARILTGALIGVLSDLIQTADRDPDAGVMGGVVVHTGRGHFGAEPGRVDLLAGISSDRHVVGHTYTWCTGDLGEPSWWSIRDARAVINVFKAARGRDKQNTHAVEILRAGAEVLIREDPNLIDEGVSLAFGEGDLTAYPLPTLYRLLDAEQPAVVHRDGQFVDAVPRTDLVADVLIPFTKVAKRRGEILQLYRSHQDVRLLVQIGETYRGLLQPYRSTEQLGDGTHPGADIHTPDLDHDRWQPAPSGEAPGDSAAPWQLDLDGPIEPPPPSPEATP
jgi:S-DNA-T family DNA segregation ATPase FtsK/SpoIIIE